MICRLRRTSKGLGKLKRCHSSWQAARLASDAHHEKRVSERSRSHVSFRVPLARDFYSAPE